MANFKVDLHSHYFPPCYSAATARAGIKYVDGGAIPLGGAWSPETQLAYMDAIRVQKAYLSVPSPGVLLLPPSSPDATFAARTLTKECNDYGFSLTEQYPDRFGLMASLPLPDVEGSIAEIDRCVERGLRSFALLTNTRGVYLFEPILEPLWVKLDAVHAIIFIHPTAPCARLDPEYSHSDIAPSFWDPFTAHPAPTTNPLSDPVHLVHACPMARDFWDPTIEYQFDTARAVSGLLTAAHLSRFPHIKFILSHLGGALGSVLDRVEFLNFSQAVVRPDSTLRHTNFREALTTRVWLDLAGAPFPRHLISSIPHFLSRDEALHLFTSDGEQRKGLLRKVSKRLVYGSDAPLLPINKAVELNVVVEQGVTAFFGNVEGAEENIFRGNAESIFATDF